MQILQTFMLIVAVMASAIGAVASPDKGFRWTGTVICVLLLLVMLQRALS